MQFRALFILVFGAIIATTILFITEPFMFQRFLGQMHPILAMVLVGLAGGLVLYILTVKSQVHIYARRKLSGRLESAGLVILFSCIAIFTDWQVRFPEDMNIAFPNSMLFYPAMAFLVEIVFHVLPLAFLLFILSRLFKGASFQRQFGMAMGIVALLEPTFQIFYMDGMPVWAVVLTWINLYLFNLTQLHAFQKHDFFTMYAYRLIYYLIWHVIWGSFRLELLF